MMTLLKHTALNKYPILRLSIPLAAGIFFADACRDVLSPEAWMCLVGMLAVCMGMMRLVRGFRHRWMFGVGVFLLFFAVGGLRMAHQWRQVNVPWAEEKRIYEATLLETPVEKRQVLQCKVALSEGENAYLSIEKDSFAKTLQMGDLLLLHIQMKAPSNGSFTEFDYASYLLYKGIGGTAYVPSDAWQKRADAAPLTLKQRALQVRERVVRMYREWGIGEAQLPVLAALTVGHKADLDKETRRMYSVAGISHVLALSGMHIGFLWLMLSVLLKPLERGGTMRFLRWALSTALLWAFAFIAGLEASVVRAVIMCMLMELGRINGGKPLSMNTLAVAALFMLLYNPFYLFDVGFQLSFLAVLFILLFYDGIQRMCPFRRSFLRGVWGVMGVSVVAQMGTVPLVMYYFSNFSVYFLLANLGVALLVPCIIYMAFGTMMLVFVPGVHGVAVRLLDLSVRALDAFAAWIGGLPYASLAVVDLHQAEVWGLYVLLGVVGWWMHCRRRRAFIAVLAVVAAWLALHCWIAVAFLPLLKGD